MASKYWIKLYIEILDDPKMGRLSGEVFKQCMYLFLLAAEYDKDGLLPGLEDMSWRLRINPDELQATLTTLESVGILTLTDAGWLVTNYQKRQSPSEAKERVKQYRDRKRKERQESNVPVTIYNEESNGNVTESNACNAPESETDSDSDSLPKGSGDKSPETPPVEPVSESKKPDKRPPSRQPKKPKEPPPPGVVVYHGIANRYPHKATWEDITKRVGCEPIDLDRWGDTIRAYIGCGWNPNNVKGMLEFFDRREFPGQEFTKARQNGHGHTATNKTNIAGLREKGTDNPVKKRFNPTTGETYWVDISTGQRVPDPG